MATGPSPFCGQSLIPQLGHVATVVACALACATLVLAVEQSSDQAGLPENLARKAHVTASSVYNQHYLPKFAVNGKIPAAGCRNDRNQNWCVQGKTYGGRAEFTLRWDSAITVAEIIYYGRTAWFAEECWKDYEVILDDNSSPVAKGQFQRGHGPQRIKLEPTRAKKITLKFLSSYGGPNTGAAEIQVFATSPPAESLPEFHQLPPGRPRAVYDLRQSPELRRLVADGKLGFDKLLFIKRRPLDPSHVYTNHCEGFQPGGGIYLLAPPKPDRAVTELLASPDGQILDLDLSYDARKILFSWRQNTDVGYQVFSMNIDGTGLKRLTDGPWHDYNACWLPNGGIAFISTRRPGSALCWKTPAGALFRMDATGQNVRRLSANYVDDFTPSVLPDGQILYSRWEYVDKPAIPIQSVWTIHPDGTNLRAFFGNRVLSPASFFQARPIPGTQRVMCILTAHNGPIRGAVGILDIVRGMNAQAAITNLTPEINIGQVHKGDGNHVRGPYETPNPIDPQRYLVSHNGQLVFGHIDRGLARIYRSPDNLGCYDPTPVIPRPTPPVLAEKATTAAAAAPDGSDQPAGEATVYLLDIYQGLGPDVPRGTVKSLRVVEEVAKNLLTSARGFGFYTPVISHEGTYAVKKVWGTVPIEEDGSASFTVPAGRPLYFIALDADGVAVQRMRSFVHFAPGETQGCIGCHEPRNTTPPLPGPTPIALRKPPRKLQPPSWGLANFDYARHVQPVLDRYCVECHDAANPKGGIDLSADKTDWFNVSYDVLTRRKLVNYVNTQNGQEANILQVAPYTWGSPASTLTGLLLAGHPDANGDRRITMDRDGLTRILTWIDLNAPYYGTYEMADETRPGGRRLCPDELDGKLADLWTRRCATCHKTEKPITQGFVRITYPERNPFLHAPLEKAAGGRGDCKPSVFKTKKDPDYQALLRLFDPVRAALQNKPRMDMPQAKPDEKTCRSRL